MTTSMDETGAADAEPQLRRAGWAVGCAGWAVGCAVPTADGLFGLLAQLGHLPSGLIARETGWYHAASVYANAVGLTVLLTALYGNRALARRVPWPRPLARLHAAHPGMTDCVVLLMSAAATTAYVRVARPQDDALWWRLPQVALVAALVWLTAQCLGLRPADLGLRRGSRRGALGWVRRCPSRTVFGLSLLALGASAAASAWIAVASIRPLHTGCACVPQGSWTHAALVAACAVFVAELVFTGLLVAVLSRAGWPVWALYAAVCAGHAALYAYQGPSFTAALLFIVPNVYLVRRHRLLVPLMLAHFTYSLLRTAPAAWAFPLLMLLVVAIGVEMALARGVRRLTRSRDTAPTAAG